MKHLFSIFSFLLLSAAIVPETAQAQKRNVWKGGFAGQATEWNCPRNWSLGTVPDETCVAVIERDYRSTPKYPVVSSEVGSIQYLELHRGAKLELADNRRLEFEIPEACLLEGELLTRSRSSQADKRLAHE